MTVQEQMLGRLAMRGALPTVFNAFREHTDPREAWDALDNLSRLVWVAEQKPLNATEERRLHLALVAACGEVPGIMGDPVAARILAGARAYLDGTGSADVVRKHGMKPWGILHVPGMTQRQRCLREAVAGVCGVLVGDRNPWLVACAIQGEGCSIIHGAEAKVIAAFRREMPSPPAWLLAP